MRSVPRSTLLLMPSPPCSRRVESGSIKAGDPVVFLPSGKRSRVKSIEAFHAAPRSEVSAGVSIGFTLEEQIYVGRGEIMVRADQAPTEVSTRLRVNYSADGFAGTEEAWWTELQLGTALTRADKFTTAVASRRAHGGADYTAWNAGVKHRFDDHIALHVRWYDTDQHALGDKYEGRLVGALSYAF